MAELIMGLGPGLFAILVAFVVAVALLIVGSYLAPNAAIYIAIGCLLIPFIVFGFILSAPQRAEADEERVIDTMLPVRISLVVLLSLMILVGVGYQVGAIVLQAPPFVAPKFKCRRKQLEDMHPTWYK